MEESTLAFFIHHINGVSQKNKIEIKMKNMEQNLYLLQITSNLFILKPNFANQHLNPSLVCHDKNKLGFMG